MSLNKSWLCLIIVIFILLCATIFALSRPAFYAGEQAHSQTGMQLSAFIGDRNFGGGFTLVNQNAQRINSATYKDRYKLIYFGFTYCPEICPLTLKKMAAAIGQLPAKKQEKILPVFITVDPARDTPQIIKEYIALFDPAFIGFTGQPAEIEAVQERYRVFAQKTRDKMASDYQMDHTSFIYLTGPDDRVIGVFMATHSPADIAQSLEKILN